MSYISIYKASAGSGKTFTLAAKYTAFLLSGDSGAHSHLLAVTFTNKATGEMKERILEKLYSIAFGTDPNDEFLLKVQEFLDDDTREIGLTLLRKRAAERLSALIHDYDHFTVQTIDSFFQSLLSNLAHELGLAANFRVEINDKEVISRAVDNILQRIAALKDDAEGEKVSPLVQRDRALRHWVSEFIRELIEDDRSWRISKDLKKFAGQLFADAYTANEEALRTILADSQKLRGYEKELRSMEEALLADLQGLAHRIHDHIIASGHGGDEMDCYKDVFGGYGPSRYWPYVRQAMAGDLTKEPSATINSYIGKGGPLAEMLGEYEDKRGKGEVLLNSLRLSRANINKLRLLGEIASEVDAINDEENHFMLAKTPILFDKLSDTDAPFVMERAGNRFEHIMIDEFQDTSKLQWGNFDKLLVNNISQGNECLLVGDVKQSIYRWRGGDWRKLEELSQEYSGTTKSLEKNFRSAKVVVDFNNNLFTKAPSLLDAAWPNDAHQQFNDKEGGFVRVCINNESLYDDVADQIRQLQTTQHIPLNQITILLRGNNDANDLIAHFRQFYPDIPLVSSEAFHLQSSRAVQRLIAALRFLRDVGSNEKDEISMAYLKQSGELPQEFFDQRVALARMPLYELCEHLIILLAMDKEKGEAPFLFFFLDEVLVYLEENPSSLRDFIRYWEGTLSVKSIPGGEVDGIRIMTIHKSKGLAFHTVLIPFCNWPLEKDHRDSIIWCKPSQAPFNQIPILPIPLQAKMMKSIYAADYATEHEAQRIENLNLLYVAFTRAKQNLLVWGNAKPDKCRTAAELLAFTLKKIETDGGDNAIKATSVETSPCEDGKTETITYTYGDRTLAPKKAGKEEAPNPFCYEVDEEPVAFSHGSLKPRFRQSSKAQEFISANDDDAATRQAYINEGILLHEALSRIKTPEDIVPALDSLRREGLVDAAWVENHRAFLTMRVASPKTRDWFSSRWQVFNEQAIICPHPDKPLFTTRRPDRVITDGQHTIVIDFKFARHDAKHVEQVEQYCQLLTEMGFPLVEGYLWYVYDNEVVRIHSVSEH